MSNPVSSKVLRAMAMSIAGTEAAAFAVNEFQDQQEIVPVSYITGGDQNELSRAAAIEAFSEMVVQTLQNPAHVSGVFDIEGSTNQDGTQYCLVTLVQERGKYVGAIAVIARCFDSADAKARVATMRRVLSDSELERPAS